MNNHRLLSYICEFLTKDDLIALAMVNKTFHQVTKKEDLWMKESLRNYISPLEIFR